MATSTRSGADMSKAVMCNRCGCRPRVEGVKTCAVCREKMRDMNKRRRAAKHAWEMRQAREAGVRPKAIVEAEQERVRRERADLLIDYAREHGYIPSLPECGKILGLPHKFGGGSARTARDVAFPGAIELFTPLAAYQRLTFDEVYLNAR